VNGPFVEITRGPIVESAHAISACAVDRSGNILLRVGDIETPVYLRSSAKPFIAAAGVRAGALERFGLEPVEIAVMSASHSGEPFHVAAVRSILEKIGLSESALQCGSHAPYNAAAAAELARRGEPFTAIHNNCSGKHAGILALCILLGSDASAYMELDNPAEQVILEFCARMTGDAVADYALGVDGCGIPAFAVSPLHAARAFMRLATLSDGDARDMQALGVVRAAMLAHPEYVAGTGDFDSVLMTECQGAVVSKGGAEGVHGDGLIPQGVGLVVKVHDGARRAVAPSVLALLEELGVNVGGAQTLRALAEPPIRNRAGRTVGETRTKRAMITKTRKS